jgi:hypothetical protein
LDTIHATESNIITIVSMHGGGGKDILEIQEPARNNRETL